MLDELHVENLGLIAEARMEPGAGLVVVTGETGTGKTLLLGALRLLRGDPARKDQIGPHGDAAAVEGRFLVDGEETILARRLGADRSRAYRDGRMVPLRELAAVLDGLVEIVGQHDQLLLTTRAGALGLIDAALDEDGRACRDAYRAAWEAFVEARDRRARLGGDRRALERELEMLRFQIAEIETAGFQPGDDATLAATAARLRNAEALGAHLAGALAAVGEDGALGFVERAARELTGAARLDPSLADLGDRLAALGEALGEVAGELAGIALDLEREPAALEEVEGRLALLGDLRRKYGETLDEILAFAATATRRSDEIDALLDDAESLDARVADAEAAVARCAAALSEARRRTAGRMVATAREHLLELGFADPVLDATLTPVAPGPTGADAVEFRFASDASLTPGPIGRVASGGELSRLVLALRLAAGGGSARILAFDEIDAGLGGTAALAMGRKLAGLAEGHQVLCVTHLPQVAAHADRHLVVERDGTVASVREVTGEARLEELARMLAGLPDSARGRDHAAELLALAGDRGR